jgi:hypothetical protein
MRAIRGNELAHMLSSQHTGTRPSHDATDPRNLEARDGMAGDLSTPLEYPTLRPAFWPHRRLMIWFAPGPPIARHRKVATYLVLTDDAARIFSARERALLLSIGGTAALSRRQRWALRKLSRMAARHDLGGSLDS